jgi:hypothetical protein
MHEPVWHKCSECLPKTHERVLATIDRRGQLFVVMASYMGGRWYRDGAERLTARVLAWTELPEPWHGED